MIFHTFSRPSDRARAAVKMNPWRCNLAPVCTDESVTEDVPFSLTRFLSCFTLNYFKGIAVEFFSNCVQTITMVVGHCDRSVNDGTPFDYKCIKIYLQRVQDRTNAVYTTVVLRVCVFGCNSGVLSCRLILFIIANAQYLLYPTF